jgi:hypothetical protein
MRSMIGWLESNSVQSRLNVFCRLPLHHLRARAPRPAA